MFQIKMETLLYMKHYDIIHCHNLDYYKIDKMLERYSIPLFTKIIYTRPHTLEYIALCSVWVCNIISAVKTNVHMH